MFKEKTNVDRMEILNMLSEGKIKSDEAQKMLDKLESSNDVIIKQKANRIVGKEKGFHKRVLRIYVDSSDGDKVRVNIPISLAKSALKIGGSASINGFDMEQYGIDVEQIIKMIDEDIEGELVNVESADGDIVKIVVE